MPLDPREGLTIVSPKNGTSYKIGRQCGSGSFGEVFKAKSSVNPQHVAIKFIRTSSMIESMNAIIDEINLTKKAASVTSGRCPSVHEAFAITAKESEDTVGMIAIVMEYIDGMSISDILRRGINLPEELALFIGRELLLCLRDLHSESLVHRDIKSSNILVSWRGEVFLCDFGVAKALSCQHAGTSTLSGTPFWMAPEILQGKSYRCNIDIFSLGITLSEMVLGRVPIPHGINVNNDNTYLLGELKRNTSCRAGLDPGTFSKRFRVLVEALVEPDPSKRPDACDALSLLQSLYAGSPAGSVAGTGSITSQSHLRSSNNKFNPKHALEALLMSINSV